jgi:putative transcriptional regulator
LNRYTDMTKLHPDTDWLTDYAAGTLSDAHALCVAAHLEHCEQCRAEVERLASVGGVFFNALETENVTSGKDEAPVEFDESLIEQALSRLDSEHLTPAPLELADTTETAQLEKLPSAFRVLAPQGLDALSWKSFGKNLSVADIGQVDEKREVALHRLEPGGAVAHHDHRGREITVVLTGSFSDRNGQYYPGDFIVKEPGEQHRPMASDNSACVCLSVTDAPVKFTGMLTRLLNPVIAYRHPR